MEPVDFKKQDEERKLHWKRVNDRLTMGRACPKCGENSLWKKVEESEENGDIYEWDRCANCYHESFF